MVPTGRVSRNPNVVWRDETKGGDLNGKLLFNYQTRSVHFLEGVGKDIWEDCEEADIEKIIEKHSPNKNGQPVLDFLMGLEKRELLFLSPSDRTLKSEDKTGFEKLNSEGGMWSKRVYFDAPLFVQFDCTNNCNLRCRHCVTKGGEEIRDELSTSEALTLIKELGAIGVFQVGFSGGEPLMRKDIFTLMQAVRDEGMKVQLTTNATLVDDTIASNLAKIDPITVGVSLEGGTEKSYEFFRGTGNFERFLKGVKTLQKYGLPVKFKSAIMRTNFDEIDPIINLAISLGVEAVDMFLFYPQGRGESLDGEQLKASEIQEFLTILSRRRQELEGKLTIDVDDKPNAFLVDQALSHSTCGAGVYWAEVLPNGAVVPCIFFKDCIAGNIREADFKTSWNSSVWEPFRDRRGLTGKCGFCEHMRKCGGGCRANGFTLSGSFLAEDNMCWYVGENESA
jgi:radical SAM protein with 4Fe4S-binding SPASM domain